MNKAQKDFEHAIAKRKEEVTFNFSCDNPHYILVEEFLTKEQDFWFGKTVTVNPT